MMNLAALEKFREAKQLEKEALMMMFPESVVGHLEVISGEVKALLIELLSESLKKDKETQCTKAAESKIKKVDIG